MTRRRKKKPREKGRKLLERPRSEERRNIVKWKKNGRRCDKRSETRLTMITMLWYYRLRCSFFNRSTKERD